MAKPVSKNAQRQGSQQLLSRWGGTIEMKTHFRNGKMHHFAECSKTKNTARKPSMLM